MKWISVKDRLPEDEFVLVCACMGEKPLIISAWCNNTGDKPTWSLVDPVADAITHWMPLPEAPQEVLEEYAFPDSPRQMAMKQPLNENGGT